ncbi:hypothetical protein TheveDRAFT_0455 [Thermanaerovibrio velox DSM 12556]|uniref:Uncharacterized protein n=2 Tax=Thermanaerovibrio TaxID=81461 RepID=H0UPZ0_9BACT|nr:hypothetical protein TheveDRAFT_0455 [Thermanaerovibrio velox DSM 12556]
MKGSVPESLVNLIPSDVVEDLANLLGCSRESVLKAISASGVDQERAVAMLMAAAPTYVAVKGRFETRRRGDLQGVFCYVANGVTGDVLDLSFWVGSGGVPDSFDVSAGWEAVRSAIRSLPPSPDRGAYRQLEGILERMFPPTALNTLFKDPSTAGAKTQAFKEALSQAFKLDMLCSIEVERFHRIRLEMSPLGKPKEPQPEEPKAGGERPKITEITLHCKPQLDPVRGKSVGDLKVGDLIPVDLDDVSPVGRLISRFVARAGRRVEFPVEAIEPAKGGDAVVKLAVSEGITAVFKMSKDMKIRVAQEPVVAPKGGPGLPLVVLAAAIGLFVLVLMLVLRG